MCSPSQGPCCTAECSLKYGDKCRDDNGCRDPSYCDGRMPHCPPSVNKPNKTICNKEFVCFMGVSSPESTRALTKLFQPHRNAPAQFVSLTVSSLVNASPGRVIRRQSPASCAASIPARTIHARARSSGTRRLTMCPTCLPSPVRLATTTSGTATCSRSVARWTLRDRWRR